MTAIEIKEGFPIQFAGLKKVSLRVSRHAMHDGKRGNLLHESRPIIIVPIIALFHKVIVRIETITMNKSR